jgi:hypothetical protein
VRDQTFVKLSTLPIKQSQQSGAPDLQAAAQALQQLPVNAIIALFQSMNLPSAGQPAPEFSGQVLPNNAIRLPTLKGLGMEQ